MDLVKLISVASALGFGVQQFLQVLVDPVVSCFVSTYRGAVNIRIARGETRPSWNVSDNDLKRTLLGLVSLSIGLIITCFVEEVRVLKTAGIENHQTLDWLVTVLTLSAGTEGANSIVKFAQYSKDAMKTKTDSGSPPPPPNIGPLPNP